jgi:hypothetical protein
MVLEKNPSYQEYTQLIDSQFAFSTLRKWTDEIVVRGSYENEEIEKKIGESQRYEELKNKLLPILKSISYKPDITVKKPDGEEVQIIHGSNFYIDSFKLLGDSTINRALEESSEDLLPKISRGQFIDTLSYAAIMFGLLTVPHGWSKRTVNKVAKYCLMKAIYHPQAGSYVESTLLLYGGIKIIANKLAK